MVGHLPGSLLARSSWRYLLEHRWQAGLTVIGIVLGVAIVVAVDLANNSARRAFALSLEMVAGRGTHQILGGAAGVPEQVYVRLRKELGLRESSPVISETVAVRGSAYTLLGIDPVARADFGFHEAGFQLKGLEGRIDLEFLTQPNAIVISARTAARLNVGVGNSLPLSYRGRAYQVTVAGIFTGTNPAATEGLLFADIAVAQELLARQGSLDRIDLTLNKEQVKTVGEWLPKPLQLMVSDTRNQSTLQMTEAFHTNLTAMSLLALLVGGLLIYSTMTFSVLRRRQTLGVYRALGVTRREVFALVLGEAALFGVIGTVTGTGLGLLLAHWLVTFVLRAVNDLYFVLNVSEFFISGQSLLKGGVMGLGVTLLSALLPAWEATHNSPVSVQQRSALEQRWRARLPLLAVVGSAMMAIGWWLAESSTRSLIQGFIALAFMVFGFSLLVPLIIRLLSAGFLKLLAPATNSMGRMIWRGLSAGISRTGLAVAALTVAVSATVGVGVMVTSFRQTVELWLEQSLSGDIYVSVPGRASARAGPGLPATLVDQLTQQPGVAAADTSRMIRAETEFGQLRLMVLDVNNHKANGHPGRGFNLKTSVDNTKPAFMAGKGILISEPLAYHQQLGIGDRLRIETDTGTAELPVLGVFYDYTSTQGLIILHRVLYDQWWRDPQISGVVLYRQESTEPTTLLKRTRELVTRYKGSSSSPANVPTGIQVRASGEIRAVSLKIFDRTFAITHVLRLLTILVAFIGVLSALMSLQLERQRELAILRATGMTPWEVAGLVVGQSGVMGVFSGLLAIPLGLIMSVILIDVVNLRAFGWSMQQVLPVGVLVEALLLAVVAALLAGCYPAYRAARLAPALALREE